jgi:malate dehydrogenase (quinone)
MKNVNAKADLVLIGAGIMSATLGMFLKELQPELSIIIIERLDTVGAESSDAWNNAGTGHSAFCELNYTPEKADGSIDISKALKIASSFEASKEFWAYLIEQKKIKTPGLFINSIPHMSFVWGAENVFYLKKRFDAMTKHKLFEGMVYSNKWGQLEKWIPLMMEGRDPGIEVAATRMEIGTDVNFGELTREMFKHLASLDGVQLYLNHEVRDINREEEHKWNLTIHDMQAHDKHQHIHANFVFIGAGGGSLPLLEKSDIPEAEGFGGFPVSGQWLRCKNPKIIEQHAAKVYGKASVGSPPMSVPHLDTRIIDGKKALLFGPYAGFSTKFLKSGSYWDLAGSLEFANLFPMLSAGWHNLPLTKYLIKQASQSPEERLAALQEYLPDARMEDWELAVAGQRVQVIKKDEKEGGVLEFGTEIVAAGDGTLAALLGASPGASTSVSIMLDVLKKCFKDKMNSPEWQEKLKTMIPSYGQSFVEKPELVEQSRKRTTKILFDQSVNAMV